MRKTTAVVLVLALALAAGGAGGGQAAATPGGQTGATPGGQTTVAAGAVPPLAVPYAAPLRVTREFAPPARRWEPGHRGVDLRAGPGAEVRSAIAGTVVFARVLVDRPVVVVEHVGGLRTSYEPVAATVPVGTRVRPGMPIGTLEPGHAGCPAEACLHWGARLGQERPERYIDPLALLPGVRRAVLVPVRRWSVPFRREGAPGGRPRAAVPG